MKKLALISSTLDQNNVKGKDKDALFTKEELSLLKDYEYLKKNKKVWTNTTTVYFKYFIVFASGALEF